MIGQGTGQPGHGRILRVAEGVLFMVMSVCVALLLMPARQLQLRWHLLQRPAYVL